MKKIVIPLNFSNNNGGAGVIVGYDDINDRGVISSIRDLVAWTPLIINPKGGNVGIGTKNPQSKLHIGESTSDLVSLGTTDYGGHNHQALGGIKVSQIPGGEGGILEFQTLTWGMIPYNLTTKMMIEGNSGNVGIGTVTPQEKLSVNGKIRAKEIKVETTNWPDYVFEESYQLPDLKETEHFIKTNKHLPGIPSAKEVAEHGVSLGEMNAKLLKKVEELTLHLIRLQRENEVIKAMIINKK